MTSGHPTFDHTVQEANIWLKAVAEQLHFEERRHAYSALRATLHALRDRLTPESAVHFGAQLPMVVRGLYYEGWRIAGKPRGDPSTIFATMSQANCRRNSRWTPSRSHAASSRSYSRNSIRASRQRSSTSGQ